MTAIVCIFTFNIAEPCTSFHSDSIKALCAPEKWLVASLGKDKGTSLFTREQSSNITHRTGIRRDMHTPGCTVPLISTLTDVSKEVLRHSSESISSLHYSHIEKKNQIRTFILYHINT